MLNYIVEPILSFVVLPPASISTPKTVKSSCFIRRLMLLYSPVDEAVEEKPISTSGVIQNGYGIYDLSTKEDHVSY